MTEASLSGTLSSLGLKGLSAYQVAVKHGYTGTESQWLRELSVSPYGIIAQLSEISSSDNASILLEAINEAILYNSYVIIPAGTYVFTSSVVLPENSVVKIVGESDEYSASMNREEVNGELHQIHNGSCLISRCGGSKLFTNSGDVILELKNLMILNESSNQTYLQTDRVFGQKDSDTSENGKLYIENCCIAGFKSVAGNANEKCCVLATRTRFSRCRCAVYNNIDGRIIDCSIDNCTDGFIFNLQSGFTTISSSRIEWTKGTGITISGEKSQDITVTGCEFDSCGDAAIKITSGSNTSIVGNMFRRCGRLQNIGYDLDISSSSGLVITGNNTAYKSINDDNPNDTMKPDYCYKISGCTNIINFGNEWSGSANPQNDDISEYTSLISLLEQVRDLLKSQNLDDAISLLDSFLLDNGGTLS